jgi:molybdopterin/thiamine biosynthesis adenylyltransferase
MTGDHGADHTKTSRLSAFSFSRLPSLWNNCKRVDTFTNLKKMTDILNGHNLMLDGIKKTLGKELMNRISSSKILVVGAGGIGCELLKNLALSGFNNVEVIDLDTIDVSNLNRQFLFRREHVGMPKCEVACLAATKMFPAENPESPPKYLAHHGNVFDNSRFNVQFFKSFHLVLNALDNIEARRRVNRLCLAANIPLIEAGTVSVYLNSITLIAVVRQLLKLIYFLSLFCCSFVDWISWSGDCH